jgi:hypothetical protein
MHDAASRKIGDGEGYGGFNAPIYSRCCQFFAKFGVDTDPAEFAEALCHAILHAPRDAARTDESVRRYASDAYLETQLANAREFILRGMDNAEH